MSLKIANEIAHEVEHNPKIPWCGIWCVFSKDYIFGYQLNDMRGSPIRTLFVPYEGTTAEELRKIWGEFLFDSGH